MFTNLKRVLQFAVKDFWRNRGISLAAVFILTITIILFSGIFFLHGISDFIVSSIQNKIDITAYFKSGTSEDDISQVKSQILALSPEIKNVQYVSESDALANFTQKHKDNPVFQNALTQVGDNPFLPSLNITTTGNPLQYQQVSDLLQGDQFSALVDSVDYSQKKDTIEKVFSITSGINNFGFGLAIILALMVILVVFNTIKLAIDSSKEEISTMRIVGASSWFIRAPFIIQGAMFGVISFIICFFVTMVLVYFLTPGFLLVTSGFSLWGYFLSHILLVILIQLGGAVALGVIASFIVVGKYLKI